MQRSAFLVTCNKGRESAACKELLDLLNRALLNHSPHISRQGSLTDYAVEVEEAVGMLRQEKARPVPLKNVRNFVLLESLVEHDVVFICSLLDSLGASKRYVHNITPLQRMGPLCCILDCIPKDVSVLNKYVGKTYKIVYKQRSSGLMCKEVLFEAITQNVALRVSLSSPDYTVAVIVIKNVVGYSIIPSSSAYCRAC